MAEYLLNCFPPQHKKSGCIVSVFSSAKDNEPQLFECGDFREFAREVLENGHDVRPSKDGTAFSLVEYAPGTTRGTANIRCVFGAALDFDKVEPAVLDRVRAAMAPYEHVLYTTFSDKPTARCFRVVVPFAAPIPPAAYSAYWESLNRLTGGLADPAAKDVARISYLPAHPPGAEGHVIEYHHGDVGGAP